MGTGADSSQPGPATPSPAHAPTSAGNGPDRRFLGLFLVTAGVLGVALAGYGGFRWSGRLDLSPEAAAGLVVLAVVTGFAAFFSPCSFPLLLGLLTGRARASMSRRSPAEGVRSALAMGVGAIVFLLAVGAVVGLAGRGIADIVGLTSTPGRILRGVVAAVIAAAGLVQLGVLRVPLGRVARLVAPIDMRRAAITDQHPRSGDVRYGFGFLLAGFG